jgi:hypothetical protein
MNFIFLKDPTTEVQLLIRNEHISAVEIKKEDQAVILHLLGGQTMHLTHEQSRQFVHHLKVHAQPTHD